MPVRCQPFFILWQRNLAYPIKILIRYIMDNNNQLFTLFVLSIPIASIAWTITHEEIFREPRLYCVRRSQKDKRLISRKFFYLFTCEYCFSHYVTILMLMITNFRMLYDDWRGLLVAGFALVWVANVYMSLYAMIKVDIKKDRIIAKREEKIVNEIEKSQREDRH